MQFHLPTLASGLTLAFLLPQAIAQTPDQAEPATQLSTVNVTTGQNKSFKSNVVQVGTFRDMRHSTFRRPATWSRGRCSMPKRQACCSAPCVIRRALPARN